MRPTNLGFRSPKERTAGYRNPSVTFDGRILPLIQIAAHPSMPKGKRFMQYDVAARRIGTTVGPGSYNIREDSLKNWNISGTPVIKPYLAIKDPSNNGYLFVGNHMVFDDYSAKKNRRLSQEHFGTTEPRLNRHTSSSSPRRDSIKNQDSLESMKNSPYLAHRKKTKPTIA